MVQVLALISNRYEERSRTASESARPTHCGRLMANTIHRRHLIEKRHTAIIFRFRRIASTFLFQEVLNT